MHLVVKAKSKPLFPGKGLPFYVDFLALIGLILSGAPGVMQSG